MDYINTFSKYDFLWKQDMQEEYKSFMAQNPSLEAFEAELKKYMAIEREIQQIPPVHNIGALSLETAPMKLSLKQEAGAWKAQFAKNLHNQGNQDLRDIFSYMKDASLKLNRKVEDLEDVRNHMSVLKEVREGEGRRRSWCCFAWEAAPAPCSLSCAGTARLADSEERLGVAAVRRGGGRRGGSCARVQPPL